MAVFTAANAFDRGIDLGQVTSNRFLVWNRHAETANSKPCRIFDKLIQAV